MNWRPLLVLVSLLAAIAGASASGARSVGAIPQVSSPCQIDGEGFDSAAFGRFEQILTDTGDVGQHFASLRSELGIVGVRMPDLVVVNDTSKCRRALNAWKSHYSAYGTEDATTASKVQGGLLVRLTPNRYSLAVAVFNNFTIATFFVTDSNFVMVKGSM